MDRSISPMSTQGTSGLTWLRTGQEGLAAMLQGIEQAQSSVALEMYILRAGPTGDRFRDALVAAARRGVRVRVLVDAFGSIELPANYLQPVIDAGGDCRWFNPLTLRRFTYRDHRKLLVIDDETAIIGGFNIAEEYNGDGINTGWLDVGLIIRGEVVADLVQAFHGLLATASFRHRRLSRFRRHLQPQRLNRGNIDLFLLSPGRGRNPVREALVQDMDRARRICLSSAYFLLPRSLRRALVSASRRGAVVQLLLPGKSDVRLAQLAARGQYARLLRGGVQIFEYQPAILHTKRYLLDDVVYVGSANLDLRSLNINYEVLVRARDAGLAMEGMRHFAEELERSRRITWEEWRARPWWNRLAERLAGAILVRLDLRFAMRNVSRVRVGGTSLRLARRRAAAAAAVTDKRLTRGEHG
jgi:cardiolipin synthase